MAVLRRAVYGHPGSPYRRLLRWAGAEYPDLAEMVRKDGIEETLGRLFEAGVYVTIDEFKGRIPIRRGDKTLEVSPSDFDNPLPVGHFEGSTSGSRGPRRRLLVDLDLVAHDAAAHGLFLAAFRIQDLPLTLWRPVAPGAAGTKKLLMHAKLRLPMGQWFSQNRPGFFTHPKSALFTSALVWASQWWGGSIPTPHYCPLGEADSVVDWIARQAGRAVHFDTNVSSAVRVCLAAREKGLALEGTFFRLGGEPLTTAKTQLVSEVGARATCHYSVSEVGHVGIGCAAPRVCDDVHLLTNKMGLVVRPAPAPLNDLPAFYLTTLLPSCPRVMLNVATGDYGDVERRDCGCALGNSGLDLHLSNLRSYEKLSTGGMQFLGSDLMQLLDEVLPAKFGGGPTDYQLVEEEGSDGRTTVQLLVSPRVGAIEEEHCLEVTYRFLQTRTPESRMMAERLREESALRLVRREPYATHSAKVLSLHLLDRMPSRRAGPDRRGLSNAE